MILEQKSTSFERPLIPAGPQKAVIVDVIDLGTVTGEYEGQPTSKRELRIGFVFPEHTHVFDEEAGPQPLLKSIWVTRSIHKKAKLYGILTSILGTSIPDQFDMKSILGMNCLVSVVHAPKKDGTITDKLAAFMPPMPGSESVVYEAEKLRMLDLDDFNKSVFDQLSEREQAAIKNAPEFTPF